MKTKTNNIVVLSVVSFMLMLIACNEKVSKNVEDGYDPQMLTFDSTSIDYVNVDTEPDSLYALAKEGNIDACGKLARRYLASEATQENHCRAYYWANKATDKDKTYVMDILEKYGFLVNGEPTSTCENLEY